MYVGPRPIFQCIMRYTVFCSQNSLHFHNCLHSCPVHITAITERKERLPQTSCNRPINLGYKIVACTWSMSLCAEYL